MTIDESIITGAPAAEAVADDVSPPENDANGAAANGKNKENQGEKEQVPIEELYDLSKPIKRVSFFMQGCILDIIIYLYVHFVYYVLTLINIFSDWAPLQGWTKRRNCLSWQRDRHPSRRPQSHSD